MNDSESRKPQIDERLIRAHVDPHKRTRTMDELTRQETRLRVSRVILLLFLVLAVSLVICMIAALFAVLACRSEDGSGDWWGKVGAGLIVAVLFAWSFWLRVYVIRNPWRVPKAEEDDEDEGGGG